MSKVGVLLRGVSLLIKNPSEFYRKLSRTFHPIRSDYRSRLNMTLRDWLVYHQNAVVFKQCSWMGVTAIKNPLDAWVYQEIIYDLKPDVIVEIGSAHGGTTLFLANMLDLIGKGMVVSVDIERVYYRVQHPRIVLVDGDSAAPEVAGKVGELCCGKTTMIIHDGAHDREHVLKDLRAYCDLVSVNSYFIVEDGVMDLYRPGEGFGTNEDGPLPAIEQFLQENPNFVVDHEKERYIITSNPMGFLKRVR
jgi:cephalosporin hydroxylase